MNLEKFTSKAQEAITNCRAITSRFGHREVSPEHLLLALLEQQDGMAGRILQKLEVKPSAVIEEVEKYLNRQAKSSSVSVSENEIYVSNKLMSLFEIAKKEADRLKDEYISVEHLFASIM
jgi:ATP-dependent Clp protease ATP-binding subunit ClpB